MLSWMSQIFLQPGIKKRNYAPKQPGATIVEWILVARVKEWLNKEMFWYSGAKNIL